ncbi:unnamed protein product [Rotaria magnacalcarata]|uniref:Uncharacterized protein n=1 Tax=Rotaria magnacalcarata TaxID=392030 RepID=A0A8S2LU46_9BILA|nr:unnamed protein product [Rotaria magnacalcarata]
MQSVKKYHQVPPSTDQVPPSTNQVPSSIDQVPPSTSQVTSKSLEVLSTIGLNTITSGMVKLPLIDSNLVEHLRSAGNNFLISCRL